MESERQKQTIGMGNKQQLLEGRGGGSGDGGVIPVLGQISHGR